jgi:hypothetical protein
VFSIVLPVVPEVNTGKSSVTVIATAFDEISPVTVDVASTVTVYTFEVGVAADAGVSKSGATAHVNTPVAALIVNNASSSDPDNAKVESTAAAV